MSYVYVEVDRGSIEWEIVSHAERLLAEARYQLDLAPLRIRWYTRDPDGYQLTRYGRSLDLSDDRHLSGWRDVPHCWGCGAYISVRVDRPRRDIALTVAHEAYHAHEDAHARPYDEDRAERFAQRLVSHLEGETP